MTRWALGADLLLLLFCLCFFCAVTEKIQVWCLAPTRLVLRPVFGLLFFKRQSSEVSPLLSCTRCVLCLLYNCAIVLAGRGRG